MKRNENFLVTMNYEIVDLGGGYVGLFYRGQWFYWQPGMPGWVAIPGDSVRSNDSLDMSFMQWATDHGTITQTPSTPVTYWPGRTTHGGWDIARLPEGTPIHAFRAGTVVDLTYAPNQGWGNSVQLRDSSGNLHRYAHFKSQIMSMGQYVSKGEVIGLMGRTGKVFGKTGIHLHYEVKKPSGKLLLTEAEFDAIPN